MIGVRPLGAPVRTRVGRSDKSESPMKTISRRRAAHDVHFIEMHAVQALDEGAHALEHARIDAEAVGHGALQQRRPQRVELFGVELRR